MDQISKGNGIRSLHLDRRNFPISRDTIFLLATANSLIKIGRDLPNRFFSRKNDELDESYEYSMITDRAIQHIAATLKRESESPDIKHRFPGKTVIDKLAKIGRDGTGWNSDIAELSMSIPRTGSVAAAISSIPIGLRFCHTEDVQNLIKTCVETARITHPNSVAIMTSVAVAFFISLAIHDIPPVTWGQLFIDEIIPTIYEYLSTLGIDPESPLFKCRKMYNTLTHFLEIRGISNAAQTFFLENTLITPTFPEMFDDIETRDTIFRTMANDSIFFGDEAHHALIIAYDSLLFAGNNWEKMLAISALHGGNSNSTGCIGGALFGALHGFSHVPNSHIRPLESVINLGNAAINLYNLCFITDSRKQINPVIILDMINS